MDNSWKTTLDLIFPHGIPDDYEEFQTLVARAMLPCDNCKEIAADGTWSAKRECVSTFLGGRTACDFCYESHKSCDGDFIHRDRILHMALRVNVGQGQGIDPHYNLADFLDPGTPASLAEELAAIAAGQHDDPLDHDYVPSDFDELEDDFGHEVITGPWPPVTRAGSIGGEQLNLQDTIAAATVLDEELVELINDAIVSAEEVPRGFIPVAGIRDGGAQIFFDALADDSPDYPGRLWSGNGTREHPYTEL